MHSVTSAIPGAAVASTSAMENIVNSGSNIPETVQVQRRNEHVFTNFRIHVVSPEQPYEFRDAVKTVVASTVANPDGFSWAKDPQDLIGKAIHGKSINPACVYLSLTNEQNNTAMVGGLIPVPQASHDNHSQVELAILHSNREFSGGFSLSKPLMLFLARHARANGMKDMILHVTSTQTPAIQLYEQLGFADDRRYEDKYDNPETKTTNYCVSLGSLAPSFRNTAIEDRHKELSELAGKDAQRHFPTRHMIVSVDALIQNIESDERKNWK